MQSMETARTPIMEDTSNTIVIDTDHYEDVYEPHETYEQVMQKKPWLFQAGNKANPTGRKAGKSMKEWMKEYLANMNDAERLEFFQGMPKIDLWRMAEGNPSEDKNVRITVPVPILGGASQAPHMQGQDAKTIDTSTDTQGVYASTLAAEILDLNEADTDTPPVPQS